MSKQLPTVPIFGIPFSKLSMDETVSYLTQAIEEKRLTHVITANPIMVMAALENPAFARVMRRADMIVPDGAGVVWAAKVGGNPVTERVTGFDLMHRLLAEGEKRRWTAYLLGTTQEIIEAAAEKLQLQYPQVRIVGYRNGFFGPADDEAIVEEIRELKPHLLFVARGMEKEEWNADYKERLGVPFIMGVGGSFDVVSGKLKRAPVAFQKLKLEWLYRLLQEPARYRRMLALPKFVVKVLRNKENVTKPRPEA
ncbi:WecB/TagA/CpsF family glycosyltransferase [Paenibacillus soyae]|uniref:N-acetylglucosaminyldiphosphoundecaprenol N-acetyl-beta-D-mannosaminyltransferase n=1 Tax=Paenibacillus soyae TaxID=2969249 RepID=A0A9X2MR65_9BACL|nr:WecB/TagA/CpsF family glycosyltransferase [Paenibacillus soyae]MCR2806758.1 WecB/TagA/CpsF family glycosyltransferase [Paenibacillus soyae]